VPSITSACAVTGVPGSGSDAAWHDLTISTDRDDATAAQRDPLAATRS
jgi:hypothetical protein